MGVFNTLTIGLMNIRRGLWNIGAAIFNMVGATNMGDICMEKSKTVYQDMQDLKIKFAEIDAEKAQQKAEADAKQAETNAQIEEINKNTKTTQAEKKAEIAKLKVETSVIQHANQKKEEIAHTEGDVKKKIEDTKTTLKQGRIVQKGIHVKNQAYSTDGLLRREMSLQADQTRTQTQHASLERQAAVQKDTLDVQAQVKAGLAKVGGQQTQIIENATSNAKTAKQIAAEYLDGVKTISGIEIETYKAVLDTGVAQNDFVLAQDMIRHQAELAKTLHEHQSKLQIELESHKTGNMMKTSTTATELQKKIDDCQQKQQAYALQCEARFKGTQGQKVTQAYVALMAQQMNSETFVAIQENRAKVSETVSANVSRGADAGAVARTYERDTLDTASKHAVAEAGGLFTATQQALNGLANTPEVFQQLTSGVESAENRSQASANVAEEPQSPRPH